MLGRALTPSGLEVILVTATNRTSNRIESYTLNPATRQLTNVTGSTAVSGLSEVYGYCMYHSQINGKYYGIVTDRNTGAVKQLELVDSGSGSVNAVRVRDINVGSQTEGCVADDDLGYLYIGEEDVAIWKYGAEPGDGSSRTAVDYTIPQGGDVLVPDIEGLAIYYVDSSTGYLLASNQGNNSYSVYEREGDNAYLGDFVIASGAIDGTNDTDGIDVSSANLGPGFEHGVFIAQDGSNSGGNQNYKYVPWESILEVSEPEPTPTPTPEPTPTPTPEPTPTPTPEPTPTPTPEPTPTPTPEPTPTPTPEPTPTPTPEPTPTPTPEPTSTPTPEPTPTPTPTPDRSSDNT